MAAQYSAVKCAQQLIELGADVNVSSEVDSSAGYVSDLFDSSPN